MAYSLWIKLNTIQFKIHQQRTHWNEEVEKVKKSVSKIKKR